MTPHLERAQIFTLVTILRARATEIRDGLTEAQTSVQHGFGAYDEAEATQAQMNRAVTLAVLQSQLDQLRWFWQTLVTVHGTATVDHAIEEGECRIGSLPYVD